MSEVKIHVELTLPAERLAVNVLIALFQQLLTQLVPQLVASWQDCELIRWLGPRWSPLQQQKVPRACPDCQSRLGFNRRGSRPRVLRKTSLGRLPFQLRQVTCQQCDRTFAPLAEQLDLAPLRQAQGRLYQVSTSEFRARAAGAVCQVSYQRGATMVSQSPLVAPVSATAVHTRVQQQGRQVAFDAEQAEGRPLLLDGTRVKAGSRERGAPLHPGMALSDAPPTGVVPAWRSGRWPSAWMKRGPPAWHPWQRSRPTA